MTTPKTLVDQIFDMWYKGFIPKDKALQAAEILYIKIQLQEKISSYESQYWTEKTNSFLGRK